MFFYQFGQSILGLLKLSYCLQVVNKVVFQQLLLNVQVSKPLRIVHFMVLNLDSLNVLDNLPLFILFILRTSFA
jgi:hypothetical protein